MPHETSDFISDPIGLYPVMPANKDAVIRLERTNTSLLNSAKADLQRVIDRLAGEFTVEHLLVAEPWPDRLECLKWAVENVATVAEMKVWHRAQNGLDLFAE